MFASVDHKAELGDGITRVDLAELIALRARAGKPHAGATRLQQSDAGGHMSALRGRGMDYAESRVYQPGDDARNIDWRRTARSGKWHTKLFQVERERSLLLLLDTHATMRFGTRTRYKSVAAARAAAWLTWTCVRGGDKVGALAFGAMRAGIAAHSGARGALAVLGALARWDQQARTIAEDVHEPLSAALKRAQRTAMPGHQAWLLTDGWCADAATSSALARLARSIDLRVALVVDPLERVVAPAGDYVFETATGKHHADLADAAARARLRDGLASGWRGLAAACDETSVPWVILATTDAPDIALAPLWRRRMRGRP
ncbi:MAG: DUF58 domain-containing protein [Rhodanobacteraceae bacterium]|nr:MAG: DUF58 domain-containing protein [Rhodanobacteraceae bacterium]